MFSKKEKAEAQRYINKAKILKDTRALIQHTIEPKHTHKIKLETPSEQGTESKPNGLVGLNRKLKHS
jgi:hypothetical protein